MKKFISVLISCAFFAIPAFADIHIFPTSGGFQLQDSSGSIIGSAATKAAAEKAAAVYTSQGQNVVWESGLPATINSAPKALPPGTNMGQKALPPGSDTPPVGQKALPSGETPPPAAATPKVNAAGVLGGALMVVSGGSMVIDANSAKATKATAGDVLQSAAGGAMTAAGVAAIVNAIPVGGQIAYGVAIAAGAVIGAGITGAKVFSETDCDMDPVLNQYACCNISKLSNIQALRANIGDRMFCDFPRIKYCMQGDSKTDQGFKGLFHDDHWNKTCEVKYCQGYVAPLNGDWKIQRYASRDSSGFCWAWECADGFTREGGFCSKNLAGGMVCGTDAKGNPFHEGDKVSDCPTVASNANAESAARWCKDGVQTDCIIVCKKGDKLDSKTNKCVKAAGGDSGGGLQACLNGRSTAEGKACCYLSASVAKWDSSTQKCICNDSAATFSIADNNHGQCVKGGVVIPDTEQTTEQTTPGQQQAGTECDKGTAGFVMFEGKCISDSEKSRIEDERKAESARQAKVADLQSQISAQTTILSGIVGAHSSDQRSVWKNSEGKFNTTRLASDSIAGAVLGTAGGLITSSVIKKNQLKSGFEDINCQVGGQSVADFGDEFRVGLR